jgi:membrane dipeptidase
MANHDAATALDHARQLLRVLPLVDGHNDLPWVIHSDMAAQKSVKRYDLARPHPETDTDIPRLKAGMLSAQFWAAFVPTLAEHPGRMTLELIDIIRQLPETYPETFVFAESPLDISRAKRAGKIASFMTVEGGVGLENSLSPLRVWQAAGVRLMTLCHNETLDWVDSATDAPRHGGLTKFGEAVVLELNRLGIIVDLAHTAPSVMHRVLDISRAPVLFSHNNAFSLCDHPRNAPDDVLDRIRSKKSVIMATFIPDFINQASRDWSRPLRDNFGKSSFMVSHEEAIAAARRDAVYGPGLATPAVQKPEAAMLKSFKCCVNILTKEVDMDVLMTVNGVTRQCSFKSTLDNNVEVSWDGKDFKVGFDKPE